MALGEAGADGEEEAFEDQINRLMESKKMLRNASYFAFTATPKNKTLEIFGTPVPEGGVVRHRPFHVYTMKQAIQEGFIIDVLAHYTPVSSYYRLVKTVAGDPEFDVKRAGRKLRRYVEDHDHAIRLKAEIMVDHFHEQVAGLQKIGGQARAMVVTSSIQRAISYYEAIRAYLVERNSPYRALVAFSGEHEYGGTKVSEASLNGFSANQTAARIREEPHRFLVCADKFQTGYDEPLLHTMYVDKPLSGVRAVQTLSRLNRAHQKKYDAFVLDFANDIDTIQAAFADYYRTTVLAEETDPNKLHDLQAELDGYQVYSPGEGGRAGGALPLAGRPRASRPDPGRLRLRSTGRSWTRMARSTSRARPRPSCAPTPSWPLFCLIPMLNGRNSPSSSTFLFPSCPRRSKRTSRRGFWRRSTWTATASRSRRCVTSSCRTRTPRSDRFPPTAADKSRKRRWTGSPNILQEFNDLFGNIDWTSQDKIEKAIAEELIPQVEGDETYQNAVVKSDRQNARIEHDKTFERAVAGLLTDYTELFKQFSDNESFRRWLLEKSFALTYDRVAAGGDAVRHG